MAQLRLLTLAAAGILALAGTASADTVNGLLDYGGQFVSPTNNDLNTFDDDNFEYHVDTNSNGLLDEGEVIRGSITMNIVKANGVQFTLGGTPDSNNDQFSGVFSLRVRALLDDGDGNANTMDIVFEPDPGFSAWVAGLDTNPVTGGQQAPSGPAIGAGTIARMWTNPTRTWQTSNSLTADANIGTFAVGDFYFDIGFADPDAASHDEAGSIVSDNGEGWVARGGGIDIATASTLSDTSEIGTGLFVVSVLLRGEAPGIVPHPLDGAHVLALGAAIGDVGDIQGTSNVNGPGNLAQAGFDLSSDTQFAFLAIVPLPTAVWPGIAMLLGLGAYRIRRRKLMAA